MPPHTCRICFQLFKQPLHSLPTLHPFHLVCQRISHRIKLVLFLLWRPLIRLLLGRFLVGGYPGLGPLVLPKTDVVFVKVLLDNKHVAPPLFLRVRLLTAAPRGLGLLLHLFVTRHEF